MQNKSNEIRAIIKCLKKPLDVAVAKFWKNQPEKGLGFKPKMDFPVYKIHIIKALILFCFFSKDHDGWGAN